MQHNPSKFLNTDWVEVSDLKAFLVQWESKFDESKGPSQLIYPLGNVLAAHVKCEPNPSPMCLPTIKQEIDVSIDLTVTPCVSTAVHMWIVREDGRETIKILSDTEEQMPMDGLEGYD